MASEEQLTDRVLGSLANVGEPRLKAVMESLVRHLHAFVREVELTPDEWMAAIHFLTAVGQKCDGQRQEFILLSDVLGVSMLVDAVANRAPPGATESSVLGPFYLEGAPERPLGADLGPGTPGDPLLVSGRVRSAGGGPIAGALLDLWQTAPNGLYSTQDPRQHPMNLRGRIRCDAEGRFRFRTVVPTSYQIPSDGPVGQLLRALGRHPWRPAHLHCIVSAPGHRAVTTMLFVEGDSYLESDAVFGVHDSLIVPFRRHDSTAAARHGVTAPFYTAEFELGLAPA
jgi:protocatechuate 3,4-dioxygenase beta subunit